MSLTKEDFKKILDLRDKIANLEYAHKILVTTFDWTWEESVVLQKRFDAEMKLLQEELDNI